MIDIHKLEARFYPVDVLGAVARAADERPNGTLYSYFLLPDAAQEPVPFTILRGGADDDFARLILETAAGHRPAALEKIALGENPYGFTHLILAAPSFHSELKGRLDAERASTVLAVPIVEAEMSGDETPDAFATLRLLVVDANRWDRTIQPKIQIRFDNGSTGSGTGEEYALVTFAHLTAEVGNLMRVTDGLSKSSTTAAM